MSKLERVKELLNERGVEWRDYGVFTFWVGAGGILWYAMEEIDGDELEVNTNEIYGKSPEYIVEATLGPTIVHCRDCKHACEIAGGGLACTFRSQMMHETTADAFCSDGEREEEK